mgnify:CR=1 FL=1
MRGSGCEFFSETLLIWQDIIFPSSKYEGMTELLDNDNEKTRLETLLNFFISLYQTMKKIYYPGYIVFLGIQGDIKMLLIFTVPTLLLFIAYVLFASKTYLKTNTMARTFENNGKFSYVSKTTKPLKALVKKEVRGFFGIPVYVINTIIGPILSVIITD